MLAALRIVADNPGFWLPLAVLALVAALWGAKLLVQEIGQHSAEREHDEQRQCE
jgi:hypothetical protein